MMEILTPEKATEKLRAEGMRISPEMLRDGIEQNAFPFGTYVKGRHGGNKYWIYGELLDQWIDARRLKT